MCLSFLTCIVGTNYSIYLRESCENLSKEFLVQSNLYINTSCHHYSSYLNKQSNKNIIELLCREARQERFCQSKVKYENEMILKFNVNQWKIIIG